MEADDENPNEWRARQTLRRPQQFTVTQQPPLALDLRHAPLDKAAAVDSCCFVATQLHLYAFDLTPENNAESPGGAGGDAGGGGWGGEELGEGGFPRMCLGLLLLQRLPELPAFPVYEAPRAEGGEMVVYRCQLRYCRTLDLSMGAHLRCCRRLRRVRPATVWVHHCTRHAWPSYACDDSSG